MTLSPTQQLTYHIFVLSTTSAGIFSKNSIFLTLKTISGPSLIFPKPKKKNEHVMSHHVMRGQTKKGLKKISLLSEYIQNILQKKGKVKYCFERIRNYTKTLNLNLTLFCALTQKRAVRVKNRPFDAYQADVRWLKYVSYYFVFFFKLLLISENLTIKKTRSTLTITDYCTVIEQSINQLVSI